MNTPFVTMPAFIEDYRKDTSVYSRVPDLNLLAGEAGVSDCNRILLGVDVVVGCVHERARFYKSSCLDWEAGLWRVQRCVPAEESDVQKQFLRRGWQSFRSHVVPRVAYERLLYDERLHAREGWDLALHWYGTAGNGACFRVLEHLHNPELGLRELVRAARALSFVLLSLESVP